MPTPTTYASPLAYINIGPELVAQGTASTTSSTVVLNKPAASKDIQLYLDDVGMRNAMAEVYQGYLGTITGEVSLEGDVRCDSQGFFLGNIFGDFSHFTSPARYTFALQNAASSGSVTMPGQAHSLSIYDWSGVTAGGGARLYTGAMFSDLAYTIDPTKLVTFTAKATTWGSTTSAATAAPSSLAPAPGWTVAVGVGGPASGGTLAGNVMNASINFARKLKVYPTLGQKQPYIIRQGTFGVTGKLTFIAQDETALIDYLTNVQPQLQFVMSQGANFALQIDMQNVYYKAATINRGSEAAEFDVDFVAIANTTNVGASGGFSPALVTLTTTTAVGTY